MPASIRFVALYLPQYHPVPENDTWWGKGFTEWTNVTKAKPLFKGHVQPKFPADLGYYDLRVPEVREAQANMAKQYGIEGFMYYHYWFGNGRQLLERPLNEIINTGKPDFPFCLCWANESWRGAWHGEFTGKTLIEQQYPGINDYEQHFYYLLNAFKDKRYIKVGGRPLFQVYKPLELPDAKLFTDTFNNLAVKEGLPGIYFTATRVPFDWVPQEHGFDAVVGSEISNFRYKTLSKKNGYRYSEKIVRKQLNKVFPAVRVQKEGPIVVEYNSILDALITDQNFSFDYYPCVVPNWDNTPRAGRSGFVLQNAKPQLFEQHLQKAMHKVAHLPEERRFVFIKSWNEWAEGNYLEPDREHGYEYLEVIKKNLDSFRINQTA